MYFNKYLPLMGALLLLAAAGHLDQAVGCSPASDIPTPAKANPQTPESGQSMRVLWTVSQYIRGPAATWSNDQAQSLIFSPLDMDDSSITFAGRRCSDVVFEHQEVQLEDYLAETYQLTPEALELTAGSAQLFRTTCDLPGFAEYLRLPNRRLLIQIEGVFFFLKAAVNY